MNITVESLPNCLATLRVEVEPERVSEAKAKVTKQFGQFAKIAGYRPGKAPRAVIERKFQKEIRQELEKQLVGDSTREAIAEKKLRVLQLANIDDVQFANDDRLSFTATVVTQPEFQMPEYKGLPYTPLPTDVSEADVDAALEELRDQAADFVDLTEDRGAEMGDFVVIDYTGVIDGKPVDELFPKAGRPLAGNRDFWIKMTDEAFFPGYCAALVGARPGEKRSFSITVPADFPVEGLSGQVIHYEVEVKSIKKKVPPELDDKFAGTVVAGKTMAEVREITREELASRKKADAEADKRNTLMRQILEKVECELPANLVRNQTQRILTDIVKENEARGISAEVLKESEKELVGAAAKNARERLKGTFVLLRIAELEGLKVTREEMLGRVAALAQRYQMTFEKMSKELQKANGLDQIQEELLTQKALEFVAANGNPGGAPAAPSAT